MNVGVMLSERIQYVEIKKVHFHKGTGDGCKLPSLKHIPTSFLGLLMVIILLLGAPTALAQTAYVEGEVIIGFQLSADENQIVAFETRYGLTKIKSFPNIRAIYYRVAAGQTTEEAIAILNKEPIVEYAERIGSSNVKPCPQTPNFLNSGISAILVKCEWIGWYRRY